MLVNAGYHKGKSGGKENIYFLPSSLVCLFPWLQAEEYFWNFF